MKKSLTLFFLLKEASEVWLLTFVMETGKGNFFVHSRTTDCCNCRGLRSPKLLAGCRKLVSLHWRLILYVLCNKVELLLLFLEPGISSEESGRCDENIAKYGKIKVGSSSLNYWCFLSALSSTHNNF